MRRALILILVLAAVLRLANVAANPGWYADEGTHLDIARHLLDGHVQYLAINQSWLLFSRLPLFELLLAIAARINGLNMSTLRLLTGGLGVVTVGTLYIVVWRASRDRVLALLAALLLAIYPPAVLCSRFGFSYNLLAPLMLIALLGVWEYVSAGSKRWLAVASLSIGLGMISEMWAFVLIVPLVLIVAARFWHDLLWSVPLALLPFAGYAAIMLVSVPEAFLFDARFALSRLNQLPLDRQIATLWQNIVTLAAQDAWMMLGAIGLVMLRPARLRWIALAFFFIPVVLLGRTTALFSLSYYYMIPLLPFMALGAASLIRYGTPWLADRFGRMSSPAAVTLGALIAVAVSLSTFQLVEQVRVRFSTNIDGFLLDPIGASAASTFVNQHTSPADLVIASPALAWMLQAHAADMQMPIADQGHATPHLPADIPASRWVFDPDYRRARYIVVDNLWRNWALPNVPGAADMLQGIETWPISFRSGEIVVYQNPED